MDMRGDSDFCPSYMRRPGPRRHGKQNSQKKVVPIDCVVELKTTANAWKPIKRGMNLDMSNEEMETLEVMQEFRAILNKLTPSTFKELMKQVFELKIDTEKKLRGTIDLILETVINEHEPNFTEAYANMCRHMTRIQVKLEAAPDADPSSMGQIIEFRKLLLTRCQRELEKNRYNQEHLMELKTKMEGNTNAEIAFRLQEDYEAAESKDRRCMLGNIRFIGELFKLRLLTESIMHKCITSLFKARDDVHLELLCQLLKIIGKDLDHPKAKQIMDMYLTKIKKIIQEKRTSSRVRFMLQDVYDLRQNKWIPRALQTQGPKTIGQICQDAKNEKLMWRMKLSATALASARRQNSQGQHRHSGRSFLSGSSVKKVASMDRNVELKTSANPWKPFKRGRNLDMQQEEMETLEIIREFRAILNKLTPLTFSALMTQVSELKIDTEKKLRGTTDLIFETAVNEHKPNFTEAYANMCRHMARIQVELEAAPGADPSAGQTIEFRKLLMTRCQREFERNKSDQEPLTELKTKMERNTDAEIGSQLKEAYEMAETKEHRRKLGNIRFIGELFKLRMLTESIMHKSIMSLFKARDDAHLELLCQLLKIIGKDLDHPKAKQVMDQYFTQIKKIIQEKRTSSRVRFMLQGVHDLRQNMWVPRTIQTQGPKTSNYIRRHAKNKKQMKLAATAPAPVNLNFQDFLDSEGSVRQAPSTSVVEEVWQSLADEQYRLEQHITQLLENKASNDDIFVWVGKNVKDDDTSKPPFLRALTISICRSSIDSKCLDVNADKISDRSQVLKKYIGASPERELQALFALQHLLVILEQPANILRKFFGVLKNEGVVSEQTFFKWEKSDDPNEQEGHGVAVASVNSFFAWLRTAAPESSE